MKFLPFSAFLVFMGTSVAYAADSYRPHSISFENLIDDASFHSSGASQHLKEQLSATGMITVSDIPKFGTFHKASIVASSACGKVSGAAKTTVFSDGTERTTLAGVNNEENGLSTFEHKGWFQACHSFDENSIKFRKLVSEVSTAFAKRVSEVFVSESGSPFLTTPDKKKSYDSILSIVQGGDHLEHFHSYRKPQAASSQKTNTVDFHTDQGLFIAFTPPQMSGGQKDAGSFFVRHADGSEKKVDFSQSGDHLVFMMGDGVVQFLNPNLAPQNKIHATPHAFKMAENTREERLWYGRMFLAPHDAISETHGLTYGKIRQLSREDIKSNPESKYFALGCSGTQLSRELSEGDCSDDTFFCWNRCMNYTAYGLYYDGFPYSEENCRANGYQFLECIDEATDTIYNATVQRHGGFRPACTNSTEQYVKSPAVAQPDAGTCTDFESFVNEDGSQFRDGKFYRGDDFVVQWKFNNRFESDRDEICFRVSYNGNVGWMAIGFYDPNGQEVQIATDGTIGTRPNVMINAAVVMGIFHEEEGQVAGVNEYVVHPSDTRFHKWGTPLQNQSIKDTSFDFNGCYSEMRFCTDKISDRELAMSGGNKFIWGYATSGTIASKHTPTTRGTAAVDFSLYDGVSKIAPAPSPAGLPDEIKSGLFGVAAGVAAMVMVFALVFFFLVKPVVGQTEGGLEVKAVKGDV
mmetsp:Transcript_4190/g.4899  ORF Transcript_4190/g.4899 Transcript_4190/m.4899 type:complete len:691 (-) Transcript_4190:176-2248(-)|eukprot:CAMPEP_0204830882 /NCGR_PEP_ID=MMETSP1346-20131115/9469_1 /ASSEMBLY_ACC=CAM_ASM_000771 /TAXON_ID=215587 /ORGANISM="Aplanochytrium stocchinoi, Strain GSBS06" /LENGTH=690 /DNA_ID=CAMNT_0051961493 /DNA_START=143 /DNA_END=2215 /DNA_ORIENTATION=+